MAHTNTHHQNKAFLRHFAAVGLDPFTLPPLLHCSRPLLMVPLPPSMSLVSQLAAAPRKPSMRCFHVPPGPELSFIEWLGEFPYLLPDDHPNVISRHLSALLYCVYREQSVPHEARKVSPHSGPSLSLYADFALAILPHYGPKIAVLSLSPLSETLSRLSQTFAQYTLDPCFSRMAQ
ncbi:hypothetical protein Ddc_01707 [Ditylenchus destructor]|nr:hypothetical protein Ddc_01707 [Ditylenchus destructor]